MFFIIVFLSIIIPLLSNNKKIGLRISFSLLFILWGLQYGMVQDWLINLGRWNSVNNNGDIFREVEPLLAYLMSLAKPLSFFGWLMACAIFALGTIYYYTRKFIPPKYYWLVVFVLMLRINYGLLFINSNRQTISVILSMYAVLVLLHNKSFRFLKIRGISIFSLAIAILILFACTLIHTAAYMSFLIIPIYLFVRLVKNPNIKILLIICNVCFISKFFINLTFLEPYLLDYLGNAETEGFDHYLSLLDIDSNVYSLAEQPIYLAIINVTLLYYNRMNFPQRFFSILYVVGIILNGYLLGNLSRATQYMYIYLIYLVPILVAYLNQVKKAKFRAIKEVVFTIIICYVIYAFLKYINSEYYMNWTNFKTVFEAPKWL